MNAGKAIRPNGSTRRGGKYSWENDYGDGKDFTTKGIFCTWLHCKPNNTTTSETKNGTDWWYFTGCNRKGNHVVEKFKKLGAISQAKKNKVSTVANAARLENLPVDSYADDYSVSSEISLWKRGLMGNLLSNLKNI